MKAMILFCSLVLLVSCNSGKDQNYQAINTQSESTFTDPEHPGKALMEQYCYACHNPTTAHEDRIAPPMIAVKMHYLQNGMSKEDFTDALLNWTKKPSEDKAKMYGAVMRFGVMPHQEFPEEAIRQISDYLYTNEIEAAEWLGQHRGKGIGPGKGNGMGSCSEGCTGNCKGMGHAKGHGMNKSRR